MGLMNAFQAFVFSFSLCCRYDLQKYEILVIFALAYLFLCFAADTIVTEANRKLSFPLRKISSYYEQHEEIRKGDPRSSRTSQDVHDTDDAQGTDQHL